MTSWTARGNNCWSHGAVKITSRKITRPNFLAFSRCSTTEDLLPYSRNLSRLSTQTFEISAGFSGDDVIRPFTTEYGEPNYLVGDPTSQAEELPELEWVDTENLVRTHRWTHQTVVAINSLNSVEPPEAIPNPQDIQPASVRRQVSSTLPLPENDDHEIMEYSPVKRARRRSCAEPCPAIRPSGRARRASLPSTLSNSSASAPPSSLGSVQKWPTKKVKEKGVRRSTILKKDIQCASDASDSFALYRKWVYEGVFEILKKEVGCSCGLKSRSGVMMERHLLRKHEAPIQDGGVKLFCAACSEFVDEVIHHKCKIGDQAQMLPGKCPICEITLINPYLSAHINLKCKYKPS